MLRALVLLGCVLPGAAIAQGSPELCAAKPGYIGCLPPAVGLTRTNVVPVAVGGTAANATLAQILGLLQSGDLTPLLGPLATLGLGTGLSSSGGMLSAAVTSVFGRAGAVALLATDVTTALGYTPYSAANPTGYVTAAQAAAAAPVQSVNGGGGAVSITRVSLGAAASGANSDITSLSGLTTALSVAQGGTGGNTAATARVSLGLGGAALLNVGTTTGTVAAGDDSRITGALQSSTAAATYAPIVNPVHTGDVRINGAAATFRLFASTTTGSVRWAWGANNTAEGGSNAGSDWQLMRYNDAGSYIDNPLLVSRATGLVTMGDGAATTTPTTSDNSTRVATTAWGQANLGLKLSLSGGTMTGDLAMGTGTALRLSAVGLVGDGTNPIAIRNSNTINASNTTSIADFAAPSTQDALISFDVSGVYASKFGLGADGIFRWGGWSFAPNLMTLNSAGQLATTNQIKAGGGRANQVVIDGSTSGAPVTLSAVGTNAPAAIVPTGTGYLAAAVPDSTVAGGNARGANAVDWQTSRTAASQVASGAGSAVLGGTNNTASGQRGVAAGDGNTAGGLYAVALGGANSITGAASSAPGGLFASDRGRYGAQCAASGAFAAAGDAQTCTFILRATSSGSTTPVRMTADGGAAGSANCINIPNRAIFNLKMQGSVTEQNNGGWGTFSQEKAALIRGDANAAYAGGAPVLDNGGGDGTTAAMSAAADTTNQCFSLTFTPPTTGPWRAAIKVITTEVVYP